MGRRIRARPAAGLCVHPHGERLRPRRHFQRGGPGADADDRGDLYLLRSKIAPDEGLTFDDLYDPDVSIRFGCYYIHLCMERYGGDVATAAAAYHSGWGTVDNLLRMEEHSTDGQTLKGFPYNQMHHYVEKITASYAVYTRLYGG